MNQVILIDTDPSRRTVVVELLQSLGIPAVAFETIACLARTWPVPGIILIAFDKDELHDLTELMTATRHWAPIICYAQQPAPRMVMSAARAGASDFVNYPLPRNEIVDVLTSAWRRHEGQRNARLEIMKAEKQLEDLSSREREILNLLADGLTNKEIAEVLEISQRTVEVHRWNLKKRLGASTTLEAVQRVLLIRFSEKFL